MKQIKELTADAGECRKVEQKQTQMQFEERLAAVEKKISILESKTMD